MKKLIIILILTIIFSLKIYSQNDSSNKLSDSMDFRNHSIFFELAGNLLAIPPSFNYEYSFYSDTMTNKSMINLLSIRLGIGTILGYFSRGAGLCMVNWQNGGNYRLEIGTGFVYAFGVPEHIFKYTNFYETNSKYLLTSSFGFKYISSEGKWFVTIALTPIMSLEGIIQNGIGFRYGLIF